MHVNHDVLINFAVVVGFTEESFKLNATAMDQPLNVCVAILGPHDIHPNINIPLFTMVKNSIMLSGMHN